MFGSKNKIALETIQRKNEELEQIVGDLAQKGIGYETANMEAEDSRRQMETDLRQVTDNLRETMELATQNAANQVELSRAIKETAAQLELNEQQQAKMKKLVHTQGAEYADLVEQSKFMTAPANYIGEIPSLLKEQNAGYQRDFEQMLEYGRQTSVLALNAAIEAGRMGESGKMFVNACEDIRTYAMGYESAVRGLQKKVEASNAQIAEMETQIQQLLTMLKEGSIAKSKMLKRNQQLLAMAEEVAVCPYSEILLDWKEYLVGIRNAEEEILRSQERNRIQVEDALAETQVQRQRQQEQNELVFSLMERSRNYFKE